MDKSPFKNFSVNEILAIEALYFVIRVGVDLYSYDDQFLFREREAVRHRNKILNGLIDLIDTGSEEERSHAMECMSTLQILPLRIH